MYKVGLFVELVAKLLLGGKSNRKFLSLLGRILLADGDREGHIGFGAIHTGLRTGAVFLDVIDCFHGLPVNHWLEPVGGIWWLIAP